MLALETEEERRAKKKEWIIFIFDFKNIFFSRNDFARPVMGTIFRAFELYDSSGANLKWSF